MRRSRLAGALGAWLAALRQWFSAWFTDLKPEALASADSLVTRLHLGESVEPLLAHATEPALQLNLEKGIPLLRLSDSRSLTAAL